VDSRCWAPRAVVVRLGMRFTDRLRASAAWFAAPPDQYLRYRDCRSAVGDADTIEVGAGDSKRIARWTNAKILAVTDLAIPAGDSRHPRVIASGLALPFRAASAECVLAVDVLEHVPEGLRKGFIAELCRVSGNRVVLTFPQGEGARTQDAWLAEAAAKRGHHSTAQFAAEHLTSPLPEADTVCAMFSKNGFRTEIAASSRLRHRRFLLKMMLAGRAGRIAYVLSGRIVALLPGPRTLSDAYRAVIIAERDIA
jgi:hypothetical protein